MSSPFIMPYKPCNITLLMIIFHLENKVRRNTLWE